MTRLFRRPPRHPLRFTRWFADAFVPLALAACLAAPALAAPAPAAIDPAAVPARPVAPNDRSEWRRFALPNGMKVLLLSDPKLNVASASVAVGVGSLSDPPERPGLAHYLEHMLFLGTEKYPSESEFGEYLQRNGGYNNAYTARDRTNYHLEIRPGAFEGALDRFAQFFIAPKFTPEFNEREVNAVHSEYQANLEDDGWREYALRNTVVREGHPARQFNIGSRETLAGTTREELLAFHRRYYSANRMTLALAGPQSLDQLQQWARTYFGPVPDLARPELRYASDYLPPKPALRVLRMEPIKDLRRMTLTFPMPDLRPYAGSKPAELVGYVLGNEGPGSLLSVLKAEGLATSLAAGAEAETPDYGSFDLQIGLTPDGLARWERVLALSFAAIEQLRRHGVPPHVFDERRTMARLDEEFRDRGEGANLAVTLANLVMDHPLAIAERVPYLWLQHDPAALDAVLGRLRPDNLLVTLVAKGLPTDRTERYFGTRYSYAERSGPAYTALADPPQVAALQLPQPNPYVPRDVSVLPIEPVHLIDEPALQLHYAQDTEFQRPLVAHVLRFVLPRRRASLSTAVMLRFYEACVREAMNETTYVAGEAGLRFSLSASLEGVLLSVDGYSASVGRLVDEVTGQLKQCTLSDDRFAALKDRLVRELAAYPYIDAYQTLTETRRAVVREFYYRASDQLEAARTVTRAQVQDFAASLFAHGRIEALSYGNVGADAAEALVRRVAAVLAPAPVPAGELLDRRLIEMAPGEALQLREALAVNNSAYRRELVLGGDSPELRAATQALAAFIGPPTYDTLRTQQQLGYIVFGGAGPEEDTHFAYFIVQSSDHAADVLQARTDAFVAGLPGMLRELPDEGWRTIVAGVRAKLEERDKSVAERAARLFTLAYEHDADWLRRDATLAALSGLTRERAAQILGAALDPQAGRSRSFLGFARGHEPQAGPPPALGDLVDWKRERRYR